MRIIFAGTPLLAKEQLSALCETQHEIVAVYTQPDRPKGRGLKLEQSPVKAFAASQGLPIMQPKDLKSASAQAELKAFNADMMLVVAYGLLLPQAVLDIPRKGCINMHFSLLPRWRGAAPLQYAILEGDDASGITIMQMDKGLDTGDILHQSHCPITQEDTALTLQNKLSTLGQHILKTQLEEIVTQATPIQQNDSASTYAPRIEKKQAEIKFNQPATTIDRAIRAYTPWPLAFFKIDAHAIRIHAAKPIATNHQQAPGTILVADKSGLLVACQTDAIHITQMQFPGKKPMNFSEILNAKRALFEVGTCL